MKLCHVLPFALIFSAAAFSQTTDSRTGTFFGTTDQHCPVGINGKLEERGMLVSAEGEKRRTDGPSLHLILNNTRARQIVSAEVVVHGNPKSGRAAQAASRVPDFDEAKMRFPLTGPIAPGENAVFYLALRDLITVSYIDIESLGYADGSIWRPSRHDNCHAVGSSPIQAAETMNLR
jgi:hypothetical protein